MNKKNLPLIICKLIINNLLEKGISLYICCTLYTYQSIYGDLLLLDRKNRKIISRKIKKK